MNRYVKGALTALPSRLAPGPWPLKRPFLGKGVAGQGCALRTLGDFHPHRGRVGSGDARRTEHGKLAEDFVVDLGDQVILTIGFAAPDLPELDGIYSHGIVLTPAGLVPE